MYSNECAEKAVDPVFCIDVSDIAPGESWEVTHEKRKTEEEHKQKEVAVKIIQKLGFFGTPEDMHVLIGELENLAEKFANESENERNRQEILDMLRAIESMPLVWKVGDTEASQVS